MGQIAALVNEQSRLPHPWVAGAAPKAEEMVVIAAPEVGAAGVVDAAPNKAGAGLARRPRRV